MDWGERLKGIPLDEPAKTAVTKILMDHYEEVCAIRDEYFGRARKITNAIIAERDEALALVTGVFQDPGTSFVTKAACRSFAEKLLEEHRAVIKERDELQGELTVERSHNAALVRIQCGVKNIGLDVNEDPDSYSTPQLIAIVREFASHQSTTAYRRKELLAAAERMQEMYDSYLAPCPHEQET